MLPFHAMSRALGIIFNVLILTLASGVVGPQQNSQVLALDQSRPLKEFLPVSYSLGENSYLLVNTFFGEDLGAESLRLQAWDCRLEFGAPESHYKEWIHSVELLCFSGSDTLIFPLGEGEFRKAYTQGRLLLKGEAAQSFYSALSRYADSESVESPVSSRFINWGPVNEMKILTLRRSQDEANLKFSVECYEDLRSHSIHSCVLVL